MPNQFQPFKARHLGKIRKVTEKGKVQGPQKEQRQSGRQGGQAQWREVRSGSVPMFTKVTRTCLTDWKSHLDKVRADSSGRTEQWLQASL